MATKSKKVSTIMPLPTGPGSIVGAFERVNTGDPIEGDAS